MNCFVCRMLLIHYLFLLYFLQKQLSLMQHECDRAKAAQKEAEKTRAELNTLKGSVACVLGGTYCMYVGR